MFYIFSAVFVLCKMSILTALVGRVVDSLVGKWSVVGWLVDLIKRDFQRSIVVVFSKRKTF